MNPLTERFPEAVRIHGSTYALHTDFRTGLRIMQAFEDPRLTEWEKQVVMCSLLFSDKLPEDFPAACAAAVKFLDCGEEPCGAESPAAAGRVYSWTKDAQYIYSAFFQTHGIDLQTAQLHWWKFVALFQDLNQDCTFERLVSLRSRAQRGQLLPAERRLWYELENVLSLEEPERCTPEEQSRLDTFNRLMGGEPL